MTTAPDCPAAAASADLPPRSLHFTSLADLLADAESFDGVATRPGRSWTAAQNVAHVARFIRGSRLGFDFRLPLPLRIVGRLIRNGVLKKPMRGGFKVPPAAERALAVAPDFPWSEAIEDLRREVALASEPGSMTQTSPLFGALAHDDWVRLHCRHAEMHFANIHRADEAAT